MEPVARGWESKSVEAQQAEAVEASSFSRKKISPEQAAMIRKKEYLELSRRRVLQPLKSTFNPQRRNQLEAALAELDQKLRQLGV